MIGRYLNQANLLYITFVMMNCDAAINYLLLGTGFQVWRQALWLLALAVFAWNLGDFTWSKREKLFIHFQLLSLAILVLLGIYTLFAQEFNLLRILFAIWIIGLGIPYFIYGRMLNLNDPGKVRKFLQFFSCFGLFLAVGLLIDSKTNLFFPVKAAMLGVDVATEESLTGENRAYFLSTSVTSFTIPFAFCMLSSFLMVSKSVDIKQQSFHLFCAMSCMAGSWFTGSRQIFLVLAAYFIIATILFLVHSKIKGKAFLIAGILVFVVIVSNMAYFFMENLKLSDRFKVGNIVEDDRHKFWNRGMDVLIYNGRFPELLVGNGLGYASSQMARGNEIVGDHYENTYLHRMSEAGIVGLLILLFPPAFITLCILLKRHYRYCDFLILGLLAGYLIICFISPNGNSPTTLMVVYVLAGLVSNRRIYENLSSVNTFGEPITAIQPAS